MPLQIANHTAHAVQGWGERFGESGVRQMCDAATQAGINFYDTAEVRAAPPRLPPAGCAPCRASVALAMRLACGAMTDVRSQPHALRAAA